MVYIIQGYRSPEEQKKLIESGVRAGPATGPDASVHITGVALDVEIYGENREREMCAALNQILPMLKNKGGVIMEGYSPPGEDPRYPNGVTNGHIDDSWGQRKGAGKSVNYTGKSAPWCNEAFGIRGPSGEEFLQMRGIGGS